MEELMTFLDLAGRKGIGFWIGGVEFLFLMFVG